MMTPQTFHKIVECLLYPTMCLLMIQGVLCVISLFSLVVLVWTTSEGRDRLLRWMDHIYAAQYALMWPLAIVGILLIGANLWART